MRFRASRLAARSTAAALVAPRERRHENEPGEPGQIGKRNGHLPPTDGIEHHAAKPGEDNSRHEGRQRLLANLEQLAVLADAQPYLVGSSLSLADVAVAAQLGLLLFPASSGAPLAGCGVSGIADHPLLQSLFSWRDRILAEVAAA